MRPMKCRIDVSVMLRPPKGLGTIISVTLSTHPDDEIFASVTLLPFYAGRIDASVTVPSVSGSWETFR